MVATVSFNPGITTNASGSFNISSVGLIQGTAYDSPNTRWDLAGGILATTETLPIWGGVGITELVPGVSGGPSATFGGSIARATALTGSTALTGFSVFDQAYGMFNTPQSPVPLAGSSMSVNFYRLGSGARIAVKCDPSLISLQGGIITPQVSWDFNDQLLQPYDASTGTIAASSTVTWASTAGGQLTFPVANWTGAFQPVAGDVLNISGATNSGTGGTAAINRSFVVVSATSTQAILAAPAAAGVFGTIGGSPVLNFGTGALNVKILDVQVGNCMTVDFDPITGFATWNRNGSCAVILL